MHSGPLQTAKGTIAPTGRRIEIRACMVSEIADDRVSVNRHYFDMATLMQQLGAAG
jgi:predicted ester cyclase